MRVVISQESVRRPWQLRPKIEAHVSSLILSRDDARWTSRCLDIAARNAHAAADKAHKQVSEGYASLAGKGLLHEDMFTILDKREAGSSYREKAHAYAGTAIQIRCGLQTIDRSTMGKHKPCSPQAIYEGIMMGLGRAYEKDAAEALELRGSVALGIPSLMPMDTFMKKHIQYIPAQALH